MHRRINPNSSAHWLQGLGGCGVGNPAEVERSFGEGAETARLPQAIAGTSQAMLRPPPIVGQTLTIAPKL